jgi:hypothetical protein
LRNPAWGAVSFIFTLIINGLVLIYTTGLGRRIGITLGVVVLFLILVINFYLDDIKAEFVQTQPTTSAEAQYKERYPVSDGFAEFDVFLDISSWVENFRIKVNANGPFNVNIWESPAPIKLDGKIIQCNENIDEISFTLQFAADPSDLGEGSYVVDFENLGNNRNLHSFKLNANPKLNTDHKLDDLPSEALDQLELEPDGIDTSSPN